MVTVEREPVAIVFIIVALLVFGEETCREVFLGCVKVMGSYLAWWNVGYSIRRIFEWVTKQIFPEFPGLPVILTMVGSIALIYGMSFINILRLIHDFLFLILMCAYFERRIKRQESLDSKFKKETFVTREIFKRLAEFEAKLRERNRGLRRSKKLRRRLFK